MYIQRLFVSFVMVSLLGLMFSPNAYSQTCNKNPDCSLGSICLNGSCVAGCQTRRDCPGSESCINQKCTRVCQKDRDCSQVKSVCSPARICVECRQNSDCLSNQTCDTRIYACVPPKAKIQTHRRVNEAVKRKSRKSYNKKFRQ